MRAIATEIMCGDAHAKLLESLGVPRTVFLQFVQEVSCAYLDDVPYHNCLHGADVMQSLHALFMGPDPKLRESTPESMTFAALMAAGARERLGAPTTVTC